jgi:hypothetical protein
MLLNLAIFTRGSFWRTSLQTTQISGLSMSKLLERLSTVPGKECHHKSLLLTKNYQVPNSAGKQVQKGISGRRKPSAFW